MFTTSRKPLTGLVSIGAWIATSGANSLLKLSWLAPASMAMRKGCLDMSVLLAWRRQLASTELRQMQRSSGDVVPHVGQQSSGVQRDQFVSEDLEGRERAIGDRAFRQQAVVIVGQQLHALYLVSLPAQQG